jgi:hypothetical protein
MEGCVLSFLKAEWKVSNTGSVYWRNSRWKLNFKSKYNQTDASCTKCVVGLCYIFIVLTQHKLFVAFSEGKQSTCQVLNMAAF